MSKETKIVCEWAECGSRVNVTKLPKHIDIHVQSVAGDELQCAWSSCSFVTCCHRHFRRHALYHGVMARQLATGRRLLGQRRPRPLPDCLLQCQAGEGSAEKSAINSPPPLIEPFRCRWEQCSFESDDPELLFAHVRYHLDCHYSGMSRATADFACLWQDCGNVCSVWPGIVLHMMKHTGDRYCICSGCGSSFSNGGAFVKHRWRQAKPTECRYKCDYCSKVFASVSLLQDHVRSHINTRRCNSCGITCTTAAALRRHIVYRHMDLRPFSCSFCDSKFKSKTNLTRHVKNIHNTTKLQCPHTGCDYIGRNRDNVEMHYRQNHGHWDGALYVCHLCSHSCRTGSQLSKHLKGAHRLMLPQGHVRFNYKRSADGHYRLVTLRYESLDVADQVFSEPPSELYLQPPAATCTPQQSHDPPSRGNSPSYQHQPPYSTIMPQSDRHSSPEPENSSSGLRVTRSLYRQQQQQQQRKSSRATATRRVGPAAAARDSAADVEEASTAGSSGAMDTGASCSRDVCVPDVLSLTCTDRHPPDSIVTDDGRQLSLPANVRRALSTGARVLVCVQNDQIQLLTRADSAVDTGRFSC